eukprot:2795220-Pyramimonas_sp.AAC.1
MARDAFEPRIPWLETTQRPRGQREFLGFCFSRSVVSVRAYTPRSAQRSGRLSADCGGGAGLGVVAGLVGDGGGEEKREAG